MWLTSGKVFLGLQSETSWTFASYFQGDPLVTQQLMVKWVTMIFTFFSKAAFLSTTVSSILSISIMALCRMVWNRIRLPGCNPIKMFLNTIDLFLCRHERCRPFNSEACTIEQYSQLSDRQGDLHICIPDIPHNAERWRREGRGAGISLKSSPNISAKFFWQSLHQIFCTPLNFCLFFLVRATFSARAKCISSNSLMTRSALSEHLG